MRAFKLLMAKLHDFVFGLIGARQVNLFIKKFLLLYARNLFRKTQISHIGQLDNNNKIIKKVIYKLKI